MKKWIQAVRRANHILSFDPNEIKTKRNERTVDNFSEILVSINTQLTQQCGFSFISTSWPVDIPD